MNEGLLDQLDRERSRYPSDKDLMQALVDRLVGCGEYPEVTPSMKEHGYDHLTMVEAWGARWHVFDEPLSCLKCSADLRSPYGPPFKREIAVTYQGRDYTDHFVCPDCRAKIERP